VVFVHGSPAPDLVVHAPEPDSQPLVQLAAAASLQQNPLLELEWYPLPEYNCCGPPLQRPDWHRPDASYVDVPLS